MVRAGGFRHPGTDAHRDPDGGLAAVSDGGEGSLCRVQLHRYRAAAPVGEDVACLRRKAEKKIRAERGVGIEKAAERFAAENGVPGLERERCAVLRFGNAPLRRGRGDRAGKRRAAAVEPRGDLEHCEAVRAALPLGVGLERGERRGDLVLAAVCGDESIGALALHDKQRHAQLRLRAALKVIEDGRNAAARAVLAHGGVPDVRKKQLFPRRKVLQTLHGGLDARAARGELRRYRVLARLARGDGHRHVPDAAVKPDRLDELKILDQPRVQQRRAA